jgi:aminoglycoside phosphotransferase (APT) family kinase protein
MAWDDAALSTFLRRATGADTLRIKGVRRLGGGAIQENWAFDLVVADGHWAGRHALVLRTDAASRLPLSLDRQQEYAVLRVVHAAGVTVPEPLWACEDAGVLGRPFTVMRRLPGEARGHALVRDPVVLAQGESLAARLGCELATLHRIVAPASALPFLQAPRELPALVCIRDYRGLLDGLDAAEPVLEWALRWLERHAPVTPACRLLHRDFRTGNFLVQDGALTAILDWEFAGFGDPLEDLGWMLARCWRFGAWDREAGGIGSRAALLAGYESIAGPIARDRIPYWEVMATVRWAVIALLQAERHRSGAERSLELALTGHMIPQLEQDLLDRIAEIATERAA